MATLLSVLSHSVCLNVSDHMLRCQWPVHTAVVVQGVLGNTISYTL